MEVLNGLLILLAIRRALVGVFVGGAAVVLVVVVVVVVLVIGCRG
jgi:hypothetical protein